jgi:hypothetical protein
VGCVLYRRRTLTDESTGITYRGAGELGEVVEVTATAFPDMHRELYNLYVSGQNMVIVQLARQGTHLGPHSTLAPGRTGLSWPQPRQPRWQTWAGQRGRSAHRPTRRLRGMDIGVIVNGRSRPCTRLSSPFRNQHRPVVFGAGKTIR